MISRFLSLLGCDIEIVVLIREIGPQERRRQPGVGNYI